jgi:hypothetical protein
MTLPETIRSCSDLAGKNYSPRLNSDLERWHGRKRQQELCTINLVAATCNTMPNSMIWLLDGAYLTTRTRLPASN